NDDLRKEVLKLYERKKASSETFRQTVEALAIGRIAENRRSRAAFLDLGNCGIIELPSELGELTWLESLSIAGSWHDWDDGSWREKITVHSGNKNALATIAPIRWLTRLRK